MLIDHTETFKSYVQSNNNYSQTSSSWISSNFLKNSQSILMELETIKNKINQLNQLIRGGQRYSNDKKAKMLLHIKQSIKISQQNIKRIGIMIPDIKSSKSMIQQFKNSVLVTLQMKLLQSSLKFKQSYFQYSKKQKQQISFQKKPINLQKAHFLQQSQQQLMEEVSKNQYKQIEKTIGQISQMYRQTLSIVKLHQSYIERIVTDVNDTDQNVQSGRKNLSEVQRRQQKNKGIIIKLFTVLYIIVFVYIVFLS